MVLTISTCNVGMVADEPYRHRADGDKMWVNRSVTHTVATSQPLRYVWVKYVSIELEPDA